MFQVAMLSQVGICYVFTKHTRWSHVISCICAYLPETTDDYWQPKSSVLCVLTSQVNGIGISQLLRCNIYLLVGDRREEGNHVVVPVVTNGCHLVREGGVGWCNPSHPFIKNGISESMKHLQGQMTPCSFKGPIAYTFSLFIILLIIFYPGLQWKSLALLIIHKNSPLSPETSIFTIPEQLFSCIPIYQPQKQNKI